MAGERRIIICCDFDGVLHSYSSGWASNLPQEEAALIIRDPPVKGAFAWLSEIAVHPDFEVCIYSSRSKYKGAPYAMKQWMAEHGLPGDVLSNLQFPTTKPAANMTIDDRAFCFEGDFPSRSWLKRFRPWNKRGGPTDV